MSLNINNLATELIQSFGVSDKDGNVLQATDYTTAYATGIIDALKSSIVSGLAQGIAPPSGGDLEQGEASNNIIANLQWSILFGALSGAFGAVGANLSELEKENKAICLYIQNNALVNFSSGDITGFCPTSLTSPSNLQNGAGINGKISGINGNDAASFVGSALGFQGPLKDEFYGALCNHIINNAEVSYSSGNVTGICTSGSFTGSGSNGEIN